MKKYLVTYLYFLGYASTVIIQSNPIAAVAKPILMWATNITP